MKIHIEYCIKWNYGPEFDRVSNLIKTIDSTIEIEGNSHIPRSGAFEVCINDMEVFSKFKLLRFPTKKEISDWIK